MKKVVQNIEPCSVVLASQCSATKFYGASARNMCCKARGFLVCDFTGRYDWKDYTCLYDASNWYTLRAYSLSEAISATLAKGYEVFEFYSFSELMEWASKPEIYN